MSDKQKHLEFIQGVINRLSSNSFLFKGWSITVVVAVFSLFITTKNYNLLWLLLGIVIIFWSIDAYYLMLERCYRDLYSKIANLSLKEIDYNMKAPNINMSSWLATITRPVLLMFYGVFLLTILILIYNLKSC